MQELNKVSVFILRLEADDYSIESVVGLETFLPANSLERYSVLANPAKHLQSLAGDILARYAVSLKTGIALKSLIINTTAKGKPYAQNLDNIHFNISHSGDYVVCAAGSKLVGIDVERIRKVQAAIAPRYFSPDENKLLQNLDENERASLFIKMWTMKESYLKAIGEGIANQLDTFSVKPDQDGFYLSGNEMAEKFSVQYMQLPGNFSLAICMFKPAIIVDIQYFTYNQMLFAIKSLQSSDLNNH